MARIMIWPDLYREHGHWLPCVTLAKTLQDAGHTVEFMGIPDCASIVDPYHATYHPILAQAYPIGHSAEDRIEPKGQRWKPHHLFPMCRGEQGLDALFANPPDLLISGYFNSLETLLLHHKYDVPIVTITTYLRHPSEDPAMFAATKLVYMPLALSRKIIASVVTPKADGSQTSIEDFVAPLQSYPELIPCPEDFDFTDEDWQHGPNVHYVEPMVVRSLLGAGDPLPTNPTGVPTDKKLIFATVGSQVQDYEAKAKEFFKNLIAMMQTQGMSGYHLVLAVGTKLLSEFNIEYRIDVDPAHSTLPKNVSLFDWVSQLDILKAADVVYTHGGLATLKEAIWEEVPIVIVPHGKDQLDNALRIRRSGLGLVAQEENLSPQNLRKLLTSATSSTWIRKKLTKMKTVFQTKEAAKPSLVPISAILSNP